MSSLSKIQVAEDSNCRSDLHTETPVMRVVFGAVPDGKSLTLKYDSEWSV